MTMMMHFEFDTGLLVCAFCLRTKETINKLTQIEQSCYDDTGKMTEMLSNLLQKL